MNPFDMDNDDEGGISLSELPPSVRARMQPQPQPQLGVFVPPNVRPQPGMNAEPAPTQTAQPVTQPTGPTLVPYQLPPTATAQPYQPPPLAPVGQLGPGGPAGQIYTPVQPLPQPPQDKSTLMFIGATLLLGGLGYWAYSKMEKDSRKRGALPPPGQVSEYDDGDSDSDSDDGEPGGALDEYEDSALPEKDVDPHEEGGIKLVKG